MMAGGGRPGGGAPPRASPIADEICRIVDGLNRLVGVVLGFGVIFVTFSVLYEVFVRGALNTPTAWANETTVYVSAVIYLMAGGYALLHRAHVRIDLVYERFPRPARTWLDLLTFVFFVLYAGALVWVGWRMGWQSFQQGETTGSPWNPPIWPVKLAIPLAGLFLLLQGLANLLRDLGIASPASRR
ncbi:MAG: TRAP transporter small permease subunit [Betaproteobacteria bacterium]|nr:MAG: TRAP transporter small permease subunit [Betaproteobacteria bacterium]